MLRRTKQFNPYKSKAYKSKRTRVHRYRKSFSRGAERKLIIGRIIRWIIILALLFGIGWLIAGPGINLGSSLWYKMKVRNSGAVSSSEQADTSETAAESESTDSSEAESTSAVETGNEKWAAVAISSVATPEDAAAEAAALKAQGVTHAVLTLKDDRGYLYYASNAAMAANSISSTTIDAAAAAKAFTDAGITPVAAICCFKDSLAPYTDRSTAVKYGAQDIIWLDTSAELGGKPWLNPNNETAQQYIEDLICEVRNLGFDTVLLENFQFPEGFSLTAAYYGEMSGTQGDLLKSLGERYEAISGVTVWFDFPAEAVTGNNVTGYSESPADFGLENVFVELSTTYTASEDGTSVNDIPAVDAETLRGYLTALQDGGTENAGLRADCITDSTALTGAETTAADVGYTGFFG